MLYIHAVDVVQVMAFSILGEQIVCLTWRVLPQIIPDSEINKARGREVPEIWAFKLNSIDSPVPLRRIMVY